MPNATSTVSIEVRTGQAAAELKKLRADLAGVAVEADKLNHISGAPNPAATRRDVEQSKRALGTLETAMDRLELEGGAAMSRLQLRFSQSFGAVSASAKLGRNVTVESLNEMRQAAQTHELAIASMQEKSAARGLANREKTRRKQLALQDKFNGMELAQQVRHLDRMQRMLESGASVTRVARTFGTAALRSLADGSVASRAADAARFQQSVASLTAPTGMYSAGGSTLAAILRDEEKAFKGVRTSAVSASSALKENSAAMREAHSVARGLSGSLGTLWMTYGAIAPLLAGAALGTTARGIFQTGKDLQYRLKFVEALGNSAVDLSQMMDSVKGSMKTPLEAAEALQALAQAGLTSDQALQALSSTMQLSTLGELSMEQAVYAVTGSLAAFNLQAGDATRVGDVFAKAAAVSNTSVEKITGSMKQASSAAANYHVSLEETTAAIVMMAQQNITGTMAGTSYRNMLKELYTPIARGAKAMDKLGISAYDAATKKVRPLSDVLIELKAKLSDLDAESRNKALEAIFGERGSRAIRPILADLDKYLATIKQMGEAQGFLAEASDKLIDTVEGASNRMQSTLQQSFSKAFSAAEPQIKETILRLDAMFDSDGFVSGLTLMASSITNVVDALVKNAGWLSTLAAAYAATKATQLAAVAGQKAYSSATEFLSNAIRRSTGALSANTLAANANAASLRNAAAASMEKAGASGALASAGNTAASSFAVMAGRLSSLLGWVGLAITAYTTLTAVVATLGDTMSGTSGQLTTLEDRVQKHLASMQSVANKRLEGAQKQAGLQPDNTKSLLEQQKAAKDNYEAQLENLKTQRDQLQREKDRLLKESGPIKETPAGQLTSFEDLEANRQARESGVLGKIQQLDAQIKEIDKQTAAIAKADKAAQINLDTAKKLAQTNKETATIQAFASNKTQAINQVERLLSTAKYATGKTGEYLKGLDLSGLLGRVKGANTQAALDLIVPTIQKIISTSEGQQISMDFGTKPKGPKDYNDPNYILARLNSSAQRRSLKEVGDLESAHLEVLRDQAKVRRQMAEQYATDDIIAGMRAREQAEKRYNDILDSRREKISEIQAAMQKATDPKQLRLAQQRIDQLTAENLVIASARDKEGRDAFQLGVDQYLRDNTAEAGVEKLFVKYRNEALKTGDLVANSMESAFSRASDALEEFATTGKLNFREFTVSVLTDLSRMAMKMATNKLFSIAAQALLSLMPGSWDLSGVSGAGANTTAPLNGSAISSTSFQMAFAKGAAFNLGRVVANAKGNPYSNGIVTQPTLAPMALFGEEKEEAIMPLTRTANGELGVKMVPSGYSGGAGSIVQVETNVYLQSDGSSRTETQTNNQSAQKLGSEITTAVKAIIQKELRQGGMINQFVKSR